MEADTEADNRGDYNSSSCTSYRRAKNFNILSNMDANANAMVTAIALLPYRRAKRMDKLQAYQSMSEWALKLGLFRVDTFLGRPDTEMLLFGFNTFAAKPLKKTVSQCQAHFFLFNCYLFISLLIYKLFFKDFNVIYH